MGGVTCLVLGLEGQGYRFSSVIRWAGLQV